MKIRAAKPIDAPAIIDLQHVLNIKNTKTPERGVLMFPIDEEKVRKMLSAKDNISLVAEIDDEVVEFLFAYPLSEFSKHSTYWAPKLTEVTVSNNLNPDNVFYYEYLAAKEGTRGVGSSLFKKFESIIAQKDYSHSICEILHEPLLNSNSISFHKNRGYKLVEKVNYEETEDIPEMLWGVYFKKLKQ